MSFPKYAEYKESGVEWLGAVPAHWQSTRLKHLGAISYGIAEPPRYEETGVPLVRATNISQGKITDEGMVFVNPDDIPERRIVWLHAGDIIVVRSGAYTGDSAIVPPSYGKAIAGFDMVLRVTSSHAGFVQYCLLSNYVKDFQLELKRMRAAQPHLNSVELGECMLLEPPLEEQHTIAAFLDRETSKIDALIAEQRRLIALLKEKRQAVISHAVTKGLDPHVKMKDSGIEWLGEVPAHWEVVRLKHVSPFISVGIVVNPSNYISEAPEDPPFIYGGDIREGIIDYSNSRRIHPDASATQEKTRLKVDDLLVVRVGAPGVTAVVPVECEGGNCASVMLVRKGDFNSHWLCYVMNTRVVRFQVEIVEYGAAQKQFNIAHAVNFWVPVPDRAEQDKMVAFLDKQVGEFDQLQAEAEQAIKLLQERRTALISAAVTGKIDVRHTTLETH